MHRIVGEGRLKGGVNVVLMCRAAGMTRQNYYHQRRVRKKASIDEALVVELVRGERRRQPFLGGRKLWHLLEKEFKAAGVTLGRDWFFGVLSFFWRSTQSESSSRNTGCWFRYSKVPKLRNPIDSADKGSPTQAKLEMRCQVFLIALMATCRMQCAPGARFLDFLRALHVERVSADSVRTIRVGEDEHHRQQQHNDADRERKPVDDSEPTLFDEEDDCARDREDGCHEADHQRNLEERVEHLDDTAVRARPRRHRHEEQPDVEQAAGERDAQQVDAGPAASFFWHVRLPSCVRPAYRKLKRPELRPAQAEVIRDDGRVFGLDLPRAAFAR